MSLGGPFDYASIYVLRSGKYAGQTLLNISMTGDGLLYLAWLRRRLTGDVATLSALSVFLAHPTMVRELDSLQDDSTESERHASDSDDE